jgi:hypothetical protein
VADIKCIAVAVGFVYRVAILDALASPEKARKNQHRDGPAFSRLQDSRKLNPQPVFTSA